MKRVIVSFLFIALFVSAKEMSRLQRNNPGALDQRLWDGNNIAVVVSNDGAFVDYRLTGESGLEWPKGSGLTAVFTAGLWVLAGRVDGISEIRTAVGYYSAEFAPGPYGSDPDDASYRIYALKTTDDSTNTDWQTWPVDQGAPWVDVDGDGVYNPATDHPDTEGDLYFWSVFNDGDTTRHEEYFGTDPLGIEVQSAIYGFNADQSLSNTLFLRYPVINKGPHDLDSVFISPWSDPDLGEAHDDPNGSDSSLAIAYTYNDSDGDLKYGSMVPAVGTIVLQGPMVYSPGDTAFMFGRSIPDYRNLPLTAVNMGYKHGAWGEPGTAREAYYSVQSLATRTRNEVTAGDPLVNPVTETITKWAFTGQPWLGTGWLDELPHDHRQVPAVGPFTLAKGDSQEVVFALLIAQGMTPELSIAVLLDDTRWVRTAWDSRFAFREPVVIVTEVSKFNNTEEAGPFYLVFRIEPNACWTLGDQPFQIYFGSNTVSDSAELVLIEHEGKPAYAVWIPEQSEVTDTTELHYYLAIYADDDTRMFWPSGAPCNYRTLIFGPDTTAPEVTEPNDFINVHYRIPFANRIRVQIEDDLFAFTPRLKWKIGNGAEQSVLPGNWWY